MGKYARYNRKVLELDGRIYHKITGLMGGDGLYRPEEKYFVSRLEWERDDANSEFMLLISNKDMGKDRVEVLGLVLENGRRRAAYYASDNGMNIVYPDNYCDSDAFRRGEFKIDFTKKHIIIDGCDYVEIESGVYTLYFVNGLADALPLPNLMEERENLKGLDIICSRRIREFGWGGNVVYVSKEGNPYMKQLYDTLPHFDIKRDGGDYYSFYPASEIYNEEVLNKRKH